MHSTVLTTCWSRLAISASKVIKVLEGTKTSRIRANTACLQVGVVDDQFAFYFICGDFSQLDSTSKCSFTYIEVLGSFFKRHLFGHIGNNVADCFKKNSGQIGHRCRFYRTGG